MAEQVTHVSVKVTSGYNLLTKDEWEKIPVPERVQIILHNKAQFLDKDQVIPVPHALRLLKG